MKAILITLLLATLLVACAPAPEPPAPTIVVIVSPTPIPSITPTPTPTPLPTPTPTPVTFNRDFFVDTTWQIICPGVAEVRWIEFKDQGVFHYMWTDRTTTPPQIWWETETFAWIIRNEALEVTFQGMNGYQDIIDTFPLTGFTQAPGNGLASAPGNSTGSCGDQIRIEQVQ